MKRYIVNLEHFNDASHLVFASDKLEDALRYIADNIEGIEYPCDTDNSGNLYCYGLYDGNNMENDGEENMVPIKILCTDFFIL